MLEDFHLLRISVYQQEVNMFNIVRYHVNLNTI